MWIKRSEYEQIQRDIEWLKSYITKLGTNDKLILDHLKMEIVEEPQINAKTVIISKKEAEKRRSKEQSRFAGMAQWQPNIFGGLFSNSPFNQFSGRWFNT